MDDDNDDIGVEDDDENDDVKDDGDDNDDDVEIQLLTVK